LCDYFPRASSYAFQKPNLPSDEDDGHQVTLTSTAIVKYVGIEKRDGLVSVGKRLLEGDRISSPGVLCLQMSSDIPHDNVDISWRRSFLHDSHPQPHDGSHTVAISAFFLSTLQTPWQRKRLIKEMWESGAGTIVNGLIIFNPFTPKSLCVGPTRSQQPDWLPKHRRG
jgi:hypothetical protein